MRPPLTRADIAGLTPRLESLGDPADGEALLRLLRILYAIGRADLPLGRLFEGHVDALQIVLRYGTPGQQAAARDAACGGGAFGVWNADRPGQPTVLDGDRLSGAKAFASGAGLLSHALISADRGGERQLVLLDLARIVPEIDRSWWRVTGMRRSETHIVSWRNRAVPESALIGRPGDYVREPWFGGGAIRFAAVQAGGIAAIVDQTREHLLGQAREGDVHQKARLSDLYRVAQSAADAVARAARNWRPDDVTQTLAHVSAARAAVYAAGETVLTLAQAAVGLQAMFVDHPLSATLTDLAVYLRQPGPDIQRDRVGEAVAGGVLRPAL